MIAGFIGILALPLANVSGSVPLAVAIHIAAVLVLTAVWIVRAGSVPKWLKARVAASYSVHPLLIVLAGLAFVCGGIVIVCFAEPATGARAMKPDEIHYFGAIFILLGTGLSLFATADLIRR